MDCNLGRNVFAFSGVIYWLYLNKYIDNPTRLKPDSASIKFITGYLIELSLSVDNIFIIAIIFSSFKICKNTNTAYYFGGILGAIVFVDLDLFWRDFNK
jgi:tellurite resistance protein TerC